MTEHDWIIDSSAFWHMTSNGEISAEYSELDEPRSITIGDGKEISALGKFSFRSGKFEGDLFDVVWVPGLSENLLSLGHATKRGNKVGFGDTDDIFSNKFGVCLTGRKILGHLFVVQLKSNSINNTAGVHFGKADVTIDEWHKRFGQSSAERIKSLLKQNAVVLCILIRSLFT